MFKKRRILLAILLFALILLGSARGEGRVSFVTKIDKNKITIDETLELTVNLEWEQVENEEVRITKINTPQCSLLELVDSSQTSKSELRSGRVVSTQTLKYIFKAKKEGIDKISALTAEYIIESDEQKFDVSSEPIEVRVVSLKEKFFSGFGLIATIAVGISTGIIGVFLLLKKRSKKQKSARLDEVADARYEREAVERLREITKYRLAGDFKKYYGSLHSVLTDYTKAKYHIEIENKSEAEIRRLSSEVNLPGELLRLLIDTVQLSEKVRFAGYEVNPNEERRVFTSIERYLRSLIPKEREEKIELIEEVCNETG